MNSLTAFTYNAEEFLREVSKKGTASDIEFHERKSDDSILTFISPLRYPEKISSLTDSIYAADVSVINVSA
ncbi:translation elongation factor EF Tu-like protein, partial [mine drainage metagenome]